ncbi:histidine--tRNA ligase [Candidatus Saccharibacteria bacterium]|nr:MAG: histidine--tRNA ligase [Candidatus Saccharibacteria bacterium]
MAGLSTEPYKGTRDFYPDDMRVREYVFSTWRQIMHRYGYEAYDAPLLEPVEVYAAKSGQELVNDQTYQFIDRGERRVAIRPEMTPSVSRMIAARRQELAYPARWYSIAQYMRYERPQRGREREFWQLNLDIFGVNTIAADAEVITIGDAILREFGAKPEMYTIRINNRRIIEQVMRDYLELDTVQSQLMIKLFDRKGKIPHEAFRDQAIEIFGDANAQVGLQRIASLLAVKSVDDLPEQLRENEEVAHVAHLLEQLRAADITNTVFDITLMRGLDYYTGTVFEFFDTHPDNNRALFGGGRYDGLVGVFGVDSVEAVGMAPGYTMIELFLRTHKLLPELGPHTDAYIVVFAGAEAGAAALARRLRGEKINVELDITGRKVDKQLKAAVKKRVPYIIFVGDEELSSEVYPMKHVASGVEDKYSFERIVTTVRDYRRKQKSSDDDAEFEI